MSLYSQDELVATTIRTPSLRKRLKVHDATAEGTREMDRTKAVLEKPTA